MIKSKTLSNTPTPDESAFLKWLKSPPKGFQDENDEQTMSVNAAMSTFDWMMLAAAASRHGMTLEEALSRAAMDGTQAMVETREYLFHNEAVELKYRRRRWLRGKAVPSEDPR